MDSDAIKQTRILIVDDKLSNVRLLERVLSHAGYTNLIGMTDSRLLLPTMLAQSPDILLLDLWMPFLDGFQVLEQVRQVIPAGHYLPIVVLTADITPEVKRRALSLGAKDFLTKPFDPTEALLRIHNLLETRLLYLELQAQNEQLEVKVSARTQDLQAAQHEILERLGRAAEYRDDITGRHTERVSKLSVAVAQTLGLPAAETMLLTESAALHDIGKIGIPDSILLKPGKLTGEEFEKIKTHTTIGARILSGSQFPLLQMAAEIALTHHERWDGTGYPQGISGTAIPLYGRIVAVVDVFDALTHERPYKSAWPPTTAVAEIRSNSGTFFDPEIVAAFCSLDLMHAPL